MPWNTSVASKLNPTLGFSIKADVGTPSQNTLNSNLLGFPFSVSSVAWECTSHGINLLIYIVLYYFPGFITKFPLFLGCWTDKFCLVVCLGAVDLIGYFLRIVALFGWGLVRLTVGFWIIFSSGSSSFF